MDTEGSSRSSDSIISSQLRARATHSTAHHRRNPRRAAILRVSSVSASSLLSANRPVYRGRARCERVGDSKRNMVPFRAGVHEGGEGSSVRECSGQRYPGVLPCALDIRGGTARPEESGRRVSDDGWSRLTGLGRVDDDPAHGLSGRLSGTDSQTKRGIALLGTGPGAPNSS